MGRGVDQKKLAEWRRRLARQRSSGLTVAAFCSRERVSVSLWKYWQRQVERESPVATRLPPVRSSMPFEPVDIIPRRSVFLRFPGGATMEIPDDRIDLVRLAIDRMAARPLSAPTVGLRLAGYRDALREAGIEPTSDGVHFGDPDDQAFVKRILRGTHDRTFVCANDLTAARLMHTLGKLAVSIPADVRVSGFDDVTYAHLLQVPLTSVRQPAQGIGAAAMRAMFDRLAAPELPGRDILLPTSLVIGRSTARPRARST